MRTGVILDKYLSMPPEDGFDMWVDLVTGAFTDDFYEKNEDWIHQYGGMCSSWMHKLFVRGKEPYHAARIIERTFATACARPLKVVVGLIASNGLHIGNCFNVANVLLCLVKNYGL